MGFAGGEQGNYKIVEAGTKRFALEITDMAAFQAFAAANNMEQIYNDAMDANGGSFQEQTRAGMAAIANAQNSGIKAYESVDADKLKFEEVK